MSDVLESLRGTAGGPAGVGVRRGVEDEVRHRVLEGMIELPVLPHVAARVLTLLAEPESDARELSGLIHRDQALAAHVLRLANSPAFMGAVRIVSLQQAVARLGARRLSEIAVVASVGKTFRVTGCEDLTRSLWRQSLAAGTAGREIARIRRMNVESGFLCGLLHGVGAPLVLREAARTAAMRGFRTDEVDVDGLVDALYVPVGVRLAEAWKLPQTVRGAIAHHRRWEEAAEFAAESALTSAACHVAHWVLEGSDELPYHSAFEALNLYTDEVEAVARRRDAIAAEVEALEL